MDTRVTGQGNNTKSVEQGLRSAGKTVNRETAKGFKHQLTQSSGPKSETEKSNPKKLKKTNKQMEIKKKPPPIPPKKKPPPIPPKQKPPPLSPKKKPPPLSAKTSSGKRVRSEQEQKKLIGEFNLTKEQAKNPIILNSINKILTHCELNGIDPIKATYDLPKRRCFDKRDPTRPEIKMTVEKEGGTNETYIFKILPHGIFKVGRSD